MSDEAFNRFVGGIGKVAQSMIRPTLEQRANEIGEKANECCGRDDGYEEAIYALALRHLQEVATPYAAMREALEMCEQRLIYDGDLFHDQGLENRAKACWNVADKAKVALRAADGE